MTTISQAREAIYQRWVDEWLGDDLEQLTPFCFDQETFTPPTSAWARVSVRHRGARQISMGDVGNRKFGRRAAVYVQLFTPKNQGTSEADTLVAKVQSMFEGRTLAGTTVKFGNVTPREVLDDGWYAVLVEILFTYEELK